MSQEGDRATDTEGHIVKRTPELEDKHCHGQDFLGSKTRVWGHRSRISQLLRTDMRVNLNLQVVTSC